MFSAKDKKYGLQIIIFCATNGKIIDMLEVFAGWNQEVKMLNTLCNQTFIHYRNFIIFLWKMLPNLMHQFWKCIKTKPKDMLKELGIQDLNVVKKYMIQHIKYLVNSWKMQM